jgi:thioester reductase-like protein
VSEAVLLSGATGFLGMELLARLLAQGEREVIVLVRAGDGAAAAERVERLLARLYDTVPADAACRVRPVCADVSLEGLGLSDADRALILARTTSILHCAASIAFDLPLAQARDTNAAGTARMLGLARELSARGRLARMVHVSTAYVCGRHAGVFAEGQLDVGQSFRNSYERSKAHAERILREDAGGLPLVVVRPSIVVGDSRCGWTPSFNVVYWPLRAFSRGLIDALPFDPDGVLDIVPVDYVADAILALHDDAGAAGTVHLVAGEHAVSNAELADLASARLSRPAPRAVRDGGLPQVHEASLYLPYFDVRASFDDARARELLAPSGIACPPLRSYFSTLLDYAERARWGKRATTRESAHRFVQAAVS